MATWQYFGYNTIELYYGYHFFFLNHVIRWDLWVTEKRLLKALNINRLLHFTIESFFVQDLLQKHKAANVSGG